MGQVLRAFEADLPFAECFDLETNTCPLHEACMFRDALMDALEAFYATLDRKSLKDLVENNEALEALLQLPSAQSIPICGARARPPQLEAAQ